MQLFKHAIFITLTFFCFSLIEAQEISGEYKLFDSKIIASDIGVVYNFNENGTFTNITHEHLGEKTISRGDYYINNDSLILNYKKLEGENKKSLEFIKKKKLDSQDRFFADLQIFNSKNFPQSGVNMLLQNKNKKNVMAFSSDENGKFPALVITDNYIQYLTFSFIAHRALTINTDTLFGYDTAIKVNLEDSAETYSNHEGTYAFIIKNLNSEGLELLALKNQKETIKLKRIN
ncbi:hypothetical protein BC962_0740 [Gillisia mitskevichiae]|uniref:Uncharacterized protein n=1 Tax=Gillisia mitskevichiae TaxID=270921 RepID=A0A495PZA0_9FLAO|nr:hypothetical protein [Gillisia mitskevichiae]RKS55770.1 hypothetical protein BC962_0740 [Gillisia mitskevichiae]